MIRTPHELHIGEDGQVALTLGLLAEAGLNPGDLLLAYADGDGCIVLRRHADAIEQLLTEGAL